jgi:hypothetical protein
MGRDSLKLQRALGCLQVVRDVPQNCPALGAPILMERCGQLLLKLLIEKRIALNEHREIRKQSWSTGQRLCLGRAEFSVTHTAGPQKKC